MQLGGEPDLGVDHAVGGQVDRRLVGDPLDRLRLLHHGERVLERRQVLQEVGGLGAAVNQRCSVSTSVDGSPADLVGEFDHGLRPQPAVEMVVQQDLRRPLRLLGVRTPTAFP